MWPRILNTALGVWLMVAPAILDYRGAARTSGIITGALAASFAIIAMAESTRGARWMNVLAGAWLLVAPWPLGFETIAAIVSAATGAAMLALALVKGRMKERLGGGWAVLFKRGSEGRGSDRIPVIRQPSQNH